MDQSLSILNSNNDMTGLDYLSLASYLHEQQVNTIIDNNGIWINIFNFFTPLFKNNNIKNSLIIYNNYETLPEFNNTSIELKINNIIEIIEWKNNKFYNIIYYRFVPLKYFNKSQYNKNEYLQFINQDRID